MLAAGWEREPHNEAALSAPATPNLAKASAIARGRGLLPKNQVGRLCRSSRDGDEVHLQTARKRDRYSDIVEQALALTVARFVLDGERW